MKELIRRARRQLGQAQNGPWARGLASSETRGPLEPSQGEGAQSWPATLQYGGETFTAAYNFLRRHPTGPLLARITPRRGDANGITALCTVMWRLPRIRVRLTDSAAGERISAHLAQREWRIIRTNRLAQGVLILPGTMEEYLSGRHSEALRRNLRRAERERVSSDLLPGPEQRYWALRRWLESCTKESERDLAWFEYWAARREEPGRLWLGALDPSGDIVGFAVATVDVDVALLEVLVSAMYPALWRLNAAIAERLCQAGVRYLMTNSGSALRVEPHVQQLQRLLRYRIAHIVPMRGH